jgi:hypothetical protein
LIACNFLVSIWCFIGWIPHVLKTRPLLDKEGMGWGSSTYGDLSELMFLSTYQPSSDNFWVAMVVLGTVTMMMSGPLQFTVSQNCKPSQRFEEFAESAESLADTDRIAYHDKKTIVGSLKKKVQTYIILVVICCIPIGVNYGLLYVASHKALKASYESVAGKYPTMPGEPAGGISGSSLAVIVSIVTTVSNLIFETIAGLLVDYQHNEFYSTRRNHRLFMLSFFRITNVMSLFVIRYFSDAPFNNCVSGRIGSQFCIFILLDLTVNNVVELLFTLFGDLHKKTPTGADVDTYGENPIELTDDYLEVIYREFVCMASFSVFPPISFLTLFTNIGESADRRWFPWPTWRLATAPRYDARAGLARKLPAAVGVEAPNRRPGRI